MSTYPGDDPQRPDSTPSSTEPPDDAEHTQPVGYWERQAAERAAEPARTQQHPHSAADDAPTSAPPSAQPDQPPYGQATYSPPPYGQAPYGQAPYSPPPYGQVPYGYPPAGSPYPGYAPMAPNHPQSTLALVLGLVGLVGGVVFCGITLVVAPFAWAVGRNAVKEIRASQGRLGGEGSARAGQIMGIIGTVLLVVAIIVITLLVVVGLNSSGGGDYSSTYDNA